MAGLVAFEPDGETLAIDSDYPDITRKLVNFGSSGFILLDKKAFDVGGQILGKLRLKM
jgi:hypothetical protein